MESQKLTCVNVKGMIFSPRGYYKHFSGTFPFFRLGENPCKKATTKQCGHGHGTNLEV